MDPSSGYYNALQHILAILHAVSEGEACSIQVPGDACMYYW